MKKNHITILSIMLVVLCGACRQQLQPNPVSQQHLVTVDSMADVPQPLKIIDWHSMATSFDSIAYNVNETGKYWPLVWWDSSRKNFDQPVMALYTAMGDARQGSTNNKGMFHESVAAMGGVLGASLVGINKTDQHSLNYVAMLKNYFNRETKWNIMMNNTCPKVALLGGGYGRDWWYDVYPNVLFYGVYNQYPNEKDFDYIARSIADKFYQADSVLNGNYDYTFFDYDSLKPKVNWICKQPDAAAGHAYVLYNAYKKWGDEKYLKAANNALTTLLKEKDNTFYEILMPFGAYTAARLNAERNDSLDVKKLLQWTFDGTAKCREGWGVLVGRWNGMDISGIVGSTVDHGGYGFLMNTFDLAWPLVPLVRYDQSYANIIGKWMLNAANAAKLFYPQYMPDDHQTLPQLKSITKGVIGYEGIVKQSTFDEYKNIPAPVAQGDGPKWVPGKNPNVTQFSVYGSAHAGIFGGIIKKTNIEGILQLDLLATDFFREKAYPTFLYYNPYNEEKTVSIATGSNSGVDLYNTITRSFSATNVKGNAEIKLPAKGSAVIVIAPAGGTGVYKDKKYLINDVVVDYHAR